MNPDQQVEKIRGIKCLLELEGYESAAKARGILPEEIRAIHEKRKALQPKRRRKR